MLAPVLREAVTNILRHSVAAACTIELTADGGTLRFRVSNDGVGQHADRTPAAAAGGGHGLPNLTARVHAAGGQLAASAAGGRFDLIAQIPLDGTGLRPAAGPGSQRGTAPALSR